MIWRIRDRNTFAALRTEGLRSRSGPVRLTYLPATEASTLSPPRVAFAIGRRVGHAVERNRLRRRLRAILGDLSTEHPHRLPAGAYLVSAHADATTLSYAELREHVERALIRIKQKASPQ